MAKVSETPATAFLKRSAVAFSEHHYEYEDKGGTRVSSEKLGVPEHEVVKTLVMEDGRRGFLVCIDPKELVRVAGATAVEVALDTR